MPTWSLPEVIISGVIWAAERIEATSKTGCWPNAAAAATVHISRYLLMLQSYPAKPDSVFRWGFSTVVNHNHVQRRFARVQLQTNLLNGIEKGGHGGAVEQS